VSDLTRELSPLEIDQISLISDSKLNVVEDPHFLDPPGVHLDTSTKEDIVFI